MICTEEVTLEDIDEAISHAAQSLKVDEFGSRMSWKKRELLQSSIDDLLDERLMRMHGGVESGETTA